MSDKPLPRSPRGLINAYFEALNSGNVEDIMSLFWDDAVFATTPDQTLTGKSLISGYYFELLKSRLPNAQFRLANFKENEADASIDFTWAAENETSLVKDGNDSLQYKRSGDAVLIQHYRYSRFTVETKPPPVIVPPEPRVVKSSDTPPVTQTKIPVESPISSETAMKPPPEQKIEPGGPADTEPAERDFASSAVNDRPEGADRLGYDDYARAFAGVLGNKETITPLTIGIYGSWGMGKSFLMKRLRHFLEKPQKVRDNENRQRFWENRFVKWLPQLRPVLPPEPKPEKGYVPTFRERLEKLWRRAIEPFTREPSKEVEFVFVEFNAWVYSGSENLWAGLITKLYREIEKYFGWRAAYLRLYQTLRESVVKKFGPLLLLAALLSLLLDFQNVVNTLNELTGAARNIVAALATLTGLALIPPALTSLPSFLQAIREFVSSIALARSDQLATLSSRKDFRDKIGFMADIKDEISFLSKLLRPERSGRNVRVVIFIDDLDRCPPAKAVEVLEAIILLLADENMMPFVVVLGIDARVIVKAVEERYGKVLVEAGISGYEYLDKIVQIPFRIPPAGPTEIERYVESLVYRSSEEITKAEELVAQLPPDRRVLQLQRDIKVLQYGIAASNLPADEARLQQEQLEAAANNLTLNDLDRLAQTEKIVTAMKKQLLGPIADLVAPVAPEPIFSLEEAETVKQFARSEWLSRNPRRVKRIINVYRISRSLDPDKTSDHRQKLIKWIVMSEQWPFRTAWILQHIEDDEQSVKKLKATDTLQTVFANVYDDVTAKEAQTFATLEDAELFESFINDKNKPQLTVADVRQLRRYTFNLNPALQEEVQKAAARKKSKAPKPPTTVVKFDPALEDELRGVLDHLNKP